MCLLQQLHVQEGDHGAAAQLLGRGAEYAALHHADYTKILFLLSQSMVRSAHCRMRAFVTRAAILTIHNVSCKD